MNITHTRPQYINWACIYVGSSLLCTRGCICRWCRRVTGRIVRRNGLRSGVCGGMSRRICRRMCRSVRRIRCRNTGRRPCKIAINHTYQISNTKYQISNTKYQTPNTKYKLQSITCDITSSLHCIPRIFYTTCTHTHTSLLHTSHTDLLILCLVGRVVGWELGYTVAYVGL